MGRSKHDNLTSDAIRGKREIHVEKVKLSTTGSLTLVEHAGLLFLCSVSSVLLKRMMFCISMTTLQLNRV
jgi:hypothetical protein